MALLFVGGIMNLVWIAGLAIFVLLEKLAPAGQWVARASGILRIIGGAYLLTIA
jgi:predicted metal-binding membrane protein